MQFLFKNFCTKHTGASQSMGVPAKILSWRTVGTPYVGMAPKKNGGHIKSAQMTRSKCLR